MFNPSTSLKVKGHFKRALLLLHHKKTSVSQNAFCLLPVDKTYLLAAGRLNCPYFQTVKQPENTLKARPSYLVGGKGVSLEGLRRMQTLSRDAAKDVGWSLFLSFVKSTMLIFNLFLSFCLSPPSGFRVEPVSGRDRRVQFCFLI